MYNFKILLYWSKEDECYIAEIPELSGCIAHGKDEFEALKNIKIAKELWIATAKEFGDEVPIAKEELITV